MVRYRRLESPTSSTLRYRDVPERVHGRCPSPSARCSPARHKAPATSATRPDSLGLAVTALVRLARELDNREARDSDSLAPRRLQAVLALEVAEAEARASEDQRGYPQPDSADVSRERHVGRAWDPLRTTTARLRRSRIDGCGVHDPQSQTACPSVSFRPP